MLALLTLMGSFLTIQSLWVHFRSTESESLEIPKLAAQHFHILSCIRLDAVHSLSSSAAPKPMGMILVDLRLEPSC